MENQVLLTKIKFHFFIHGSYSGPVRNSTFPFLSVYYTWMCLQCGTCGKEPPCQRGKHKKCGFDFWVEKIPWRRALQPTPVFLPGESHGQRSAESDMTEATERARICLQYSCFNLCSKGTNLSPCWFHLKVCLCRSKLVPFTNFSLKLISYWDGCLS